MKISPAHFRIGAVLAVTVFTVCCTKTDRVVLYCNPDDQSGNWREHAMHIDLERRLIYGDDTSSTIAPFLSGHFAGIKGQFPLLLFSESIDPSEIHGEIVVNDIVFRVSPIEGSFGDLWLITAKPREDGSEQESLQHSTVLYSTQDGVLLIGLPVFIGQEIYPNNYVPCGKRTLRYDDFRLFSDANG